MTKGRHRSTGADGPTPDSVADLTPDADPETVARSILLRQLTAGPRTRQQLAAALRRRAVPEEVIERVLDRFTEVQLVDDGEFARQWVQTRHPGRGLAGQALAQELRHRGVDEEVVKNAVAELDPETELHTAQELVRRRLPFTRGDDPARQERRLTGMLARKGYGPGVARRAIRQAIQDAAEAGDFDRRTRGSSTGEEFDRGRDDVADGVMDDGPVDDLSPDPWITS